jgi:hypothetical protein
MYGITRAKLFFPLSSEESTGNVARGILFFNSGSSTLHEHGIILKPIFTLQFIYLRCSQMYM